MWQAKGLPEEVFGSVAKKGVTGEISEVCQGKDLTGFCWKVGIGCGSFRGAAQWPSIYKLARNLASNENIIAHRHYLSSNIYKWCVLRGIAAEEGMPGTIPAECQKSGGTFASLSAGKPPHSKRAGALAADRMKECGVQAARNHRSSRRGPKE